jgi:hypothetical protein
MVVPLLSSIRSIEIRQKPAKVLIMVARYILSLFIVAAIGAQAGISFAQPASLPASPALNYSTDPSRLVTIGQINWIVRNCMRNIAIAYQQEVVRDQSISAIQMNQKCNPLLFGKLKTSEQKQLKPQCDGYEQDIERRRIQKIHINTLRPYFAAQERMDSARDVYEHSSATEAPQITNIVLKCWHTNFAQLSPDIQQQIKPVCDVIARQLAEQRVRGRIEVVLRESLNRSRNANSLSTILQNALQRNKVMDAKDAVLNPQ